MKTIMHSLILPLFTLLTLTNLAHANGKNTYNYAPCIDPLRESTYTILNNSSKKDLQKREEILSLLQQTFNSPPCHEMLEKIGSCENAAHAILKNYLNCSYPFMDQLYAAVEEPVSPLKTSLYYNYIKPTFQPIINFWQNALDGEMKRYGSDIQFRRTPFAKGYITPQNCHPYSPLEDSILKNLKQNCNEPPPPSPSSFSAQKIEELQQNLTYTQNQNDNLFHNLQDLEAENNLLQLTNQHLQGNNTLLEKEKKLADQQLEQFEKEQTKALNEKDQEYAQQLAATNQEKQKVVEELAATLAAKNATEKALKEEQDKSNQLNGNLQTCIVEKSSLSLSEETLKEENKNLKEENEVLKNKNTSDQQSAQKAIAELKKQLTELQQSLAENAQQLAIARNQTLPQVMPSPVETQLPCICPTYPLPTTLKEKLMAETVALVPSMTPQERTEFTSVWELIFRLENSSKETCQEAMSTVHAIFLAQLTQENSKHAVEVALLKDKNSIQKENFKKEIKEKNELKTRIHQQNFELFIQSGQLTALLEENAELKQQLKEAIASNRVAGQAIEKLLWNAVPTLQKEIEELKADQVKLETILASKNIAIGDLKGLESDLKQKNASLTSQIKQGRTDLIALQKEYDYLLKEVIQKFSEALREAQKKQRAHDKTQSETIFNLQTEVASKNLIISELERKVAKWGNFFQQLYTRVHGSLRDSLLSDAEIENLKEDVSNIVNNLQIAEAEVMAGKKESEEARKSYQNYLEYLFKQFKDFKEYTEIKLGAKDDKICKLEEDLKEMTKDRITWQARQENEVKDRQQEKEAREEQERLAKEEARQQKQAERQKKKQAAYDKTVEELNQLHSQIPVYADLSEKMLKILEKAGSEQTFALKPLVKGKNLKEHSILKNEVNGMHFIGYADKNGSLKEQLLQILQNKKKVSALDTLETLLAAKPLIITDGNNLEYSLTLQIKKVLTKEIFIQKTLDKLKIDPTLHNNLEAYFVTFHLSETPQSTQKRTAQSKEWATETSRKKIHEEQYAFLEKNIPVYVAMETHDLPGYHFEWRFAGKPAVKIGVLPNVEGHKFIGYMSENDVLEGESLQLTINQTNAGPVFSSFIPGPKKLEGIELNGKKFNVAVETSIAEVRATGNSKAIKIFKVKMLKPTRINSLRDELRKAMRETG